RTKPTVVHHDPRPTHFTHRAFRCLAFHVTVFTTRVYACLVTPHIDRPPSESTCPVSATSSTSPLRNATRSSNRSTPPTRLHAAAGSTGARGCCYPTREPGRCCTH